MNKKKKRICCNQDLQLRSWKTRPWRRASSWLDSGARVVGAGGSTVAAAATAVEDKASYVTMYISITKPERDTFLQQTTGCLMPGYTGHCPTLKFRIGKRYGASTQEIIREMGERGVWAKRMLESHYRQVDPLKGLLEGGDFRPIEKTKGQIKPPAGRSKRYILGYTDEHISPEQPPIAGYTGHIPRIKSSEASLSLRYHEAAKKGLYLLQQDRERLRTMEGISSVPYQTPVY